MNIYEEALTRIVSLCDNENPEHEQIWHIAHEAIATPTHGRTADQQGVQTCRICKCFLFDKDGFCEQCKTHCDQKFHIERIICPECNYVQDATVEHTIPFPTYVHECEKCKHIIMESEWNNAEKLTAGRTAEEILKEVAGECYKDPNLIQAMHDFRNQPQEGREEIECTHPYKECVMSDRVNKNGTPLTRCSVCGNDNICDEEVIDDTVNTFTKEDMLAAFCAAEGVRRF